MKHVIKTQYFFHYFFIPAEKALSRKDGIYTFEETVSKLGTGTFHIIILLVCGAGLLSSMNESLLIGFIIPSMKCDFPISTFQQGILSTAAISGFLMSSSFWGFMADTLGRKTVMQRSLLTTFLLSVLSSLSTNAWMMIGLRFYAGFW